jgi:beta-N-acetylhexosaminidase
MALNAAPLAAIFGLSGQRLTEAERAFFRRVRPTGYILFARNIDTPEQVAALTKDLRALATDYDAFILIDQEGGRVQRLKPPYWRHAPASGEFEALYRRHAERGLAAVRLNAQLIGEELRALGIDVDCAPVADVPVEGAHDIIGDRAFSKDPEAVGTLAGAVCDGLLDAGVAPVIKHIPGHGRAMSDSHLELPVVAEPLDVLRATDFVPFKRLCSHNSPPFAMTAHVVYRAIDPDRPATCSKRVIEDVIRAEIGFEGVIMSDDLGMKALAGPFDARAAAARDGGCDLMLHCDGNLADMEAVASAAGPANARVLAALEHPKRHHARAAIDHTPVAVMHVLNALRHG